MPLPEQPAPLAPTRGFAAVARVACLLACAVLTVALSVAVLRTWHWPIVGDAPIFHYIVFLIDHGLVPYRDIVDINMPGTYALQWFAIHALGPGAEGWRVFDLGLLAVCGAAMLSIAWPASREAGWFGAALFALLHLRDGPTHTGQRDLMMTAFVLLGCAAMFAAARRPTAIRTFLFGLAMGTASIVKPSGVCFAAAFGGLLWWTLRRARGQRHIAAARPMQGTRAGTGTGSWLGVAAVAGGALPVLGCVVWLGRRGALGPFLALNRGLVAYHASLGRPSLAALVVGSFPSVLLAVTIPAAVVLVALRLWRGWGAAVLITGAALGAFSYVLQGKGFPYHRYPCEAFCCVGCGLVLMRGMRAAGWPRYAALTGVLLGGLYLGPASAAVASGFDWRNQQFNHALAADLQTLGGPAALQREVQCLDMTSGCLNTLYNERIVQATGYLYDCYLFQPVQTAVSTRYRDDFWQALTAARPRVLVVTDQQCFAMTRNWDGPDRWPRFAALLRDDYTLAKQYTPPDRVGWWRKPAVPYSYRLYVRKDTPLSPTP